MSLAASAARGRPSGLQGRSAAPRHNGVGAGAGDVARRLRACGTALKGPRPPALRGGHRLAPGSPLRRWSTFRCSSPSSRSGSSPLASRSPGWSRRRRSRRGSSWRVTGRATAARLAPRRGPTRITTRRPTREAAKEGKQLELRRRPAATRRRGDRMGSAISGTPRSGPQAVKDARSARLVEPIP